MFDSAARILLYRSFHPSLPPIDQTTIEMFFYLFFKKKKMWCLINSVCCKLFSFPLLCLRGCLKDFPLGTVRNYA